MNQSFTSVSVSDLRNLWEIAGFSFLQGNIVHVVSEKSSRRPRPTISPLALIYLAKAKGVKPS